MIRDRRWAIVVVIVAAWATTRLGAQAPAQEPADGIAASAAARFAGHTAMVCEAVAEARRAGPGDPNSHLILRGPSGEAVTVTISKRDRATFGPSLEDNLRNRRVCVNGKITKKSGGFEIVVTSPDQFKWVAPLALSRPSDFAPGVLDATVSSAGITLPQPLTRPNPGYTTAAMQAKIRGNVQMRILVAADGTVTDVRIMRSLDPLLGLDDAAVRTARQWTFTPAKRDGVAIPVVMVLEMSFNVR